MMKFNEDLIENRWIIGVSGGSDSMALLDMCYRQGVDVIVAHMNYQLRESADRDMKIVKQYCDERNIVCCIKYQQEKCEHNFQDFARKQRYAFYHELIQTYHAKGVLVAHQLDDVIETYMMQKQRKSVPEYYGIKDETILMGCLVKRPLLEYTKQELKEYCDSGHITYGEDESNTSRKYTRNRIRMDMINHMTRSEKEMMITEINEKNDEHQAFQQRVQAFYQGWNHTIDELQQLPLAEQYGVLDHMIYNASKRHVSKKELVQIQQSLSAKNFNRTIFEYELQVSYGNVDIVKQTQPFSYRFDHIEYRKTPYFQISDHGKKIEAITLQDKDFPITIRSARQHDKIRLRFGTKSVHRWFIDRKIPANERKTWPVVENAEGNIIFVAKIGCDIEHFSNNPTLFVIK